MNNPLSFSMKDIEALQKENEILREQLKKANAATTKEQIRITTPQGELVATLATDPDYPGIFLDIEKNGYIYPLVLADFTNGAIKVRVWNGTAEDADYIYTHDVAPS